MKLVEAIRRLVARKRGRQCLPSPSSDPVQESGPALTVVPAPSVTPPNDGGPSSSHLTLSASASDLFTRPESPPVHEETPKHQDQDPALQLAAESNAKIQNNNCAFLQLPADIMYLVFQALEPQHRHVLAVTCRALRGFHAAVPLLRNQHLTRDQHLEYLACIARSLPEQWVCEVCLELHLLDPLDTPKNPLSLTCPRKWVSWSSGAYGLLNCTLDRRLIQLDHRHIQLALKQLRLWNEPSEYVKELLAAHHHAHFKTYGFGKRQVNTLATRHSVYPKAKVGADGHLRYLTLSTWLYQRDRQPVSLDAMGDLMICPHLGFAPYDAPPGYSFPALWQYPYWPADQLAVAIKATLIQQDDDRTAATEVRGACPRCPTDFAVQASPDCAELHVWRDLGTEGSPTSLTWRVHVRDLRPSYRNGICDGLTLEHEPGSVRALYEGVDEYSKPPSDGH
jgi:hypothetical protein